MTKKYLTHQSASCISLYVCCLLDERLLKCQLGSPLIYLVSTFMENPDNSARKLVIMECGTHRKSFKLSKVEMITLK